jgi:hypothetical protein
MSFPLRSGRTAHDDSIAGTVWRSLGYVGIPVIILDAIGSLSFTLHTREAIGGAATARFAPPDGQSYFGMFIRTWESDDAAVEDQRRFAERLQDSIDVAVAGKSPTILLVPPIWPTEERGLIPLRNALVQIRRHFRGDGLRSTSRALAGDLRPYDCLFVDRRAFVGGDPR